MIKLSDIAEYCGVSITQVSRSINGSSGVSKKTKEKVLLAASELGYVKNIYASNLANKMSNQIAIIMEGIEYDTEEITNENAFSLLKGINEFTSKNNFEPLIYMKNRYSKLNHVEFCQQRMASGLILFGSNYDDKDFIELKKSDFPCVTVDILVEDENKGCVVVNNSYYSQAAINCLVENGCENIAMLAGGKNAQVTYERENGYKIGLTSNKLPINEDLILYCDFDMKIAKKRVKELIANFPYIDGIFCMSDQMAIGAMEGLYEMGKRIPEDIKIFGFDGIPLGKFVTPSLSTIRQDFRKKGYEAAKLLTEIITKKNTQNTIVVPCEIIERNSSRL